MPPQIRNLALITAVLFGVIILYTIAAPPSRQTEVPFSTFLNLVESGQVSEAIIQGDLVQGRTMNEDYFTTQIPRFYGELIPMLHERGVNFSVESRESQGLFLAILSSWLPILLIIAVWIFFMRQMQGGNKMMNFGKTKPKEQDENQVVVTFDDVAGIDESKAELDEIVEFLKDPSKFDKLGGKIPTGVLLSGEPGTGKTLLAKAIAGEAGVSFLSISGSDFVEMFVGVGASRVRDLFSQARATAPCIVFIDEIDAVGRHRGTGMGGGNDEREQTLNQLLVEMDGFNGNDGVIVIAATNRVDVLDSALTRPGRFDRQVSVPRPDMGGRQKILQVHTKNIQLANDLNLKILAQATPGFTGADLANLCNEAALTAARLNKATVEMADFEEARDKIMMGKERRSMVISDEEKKVTAYHEAGHALVATLLDEVDSVHKVTIIPRGRALGLTMLLPEEEKHSQTESQLLSALAMMMGGRAAEEIIFNHFTTGASNDLERATAIANKMVCSWGMSQKVGPIYLAAAGGSGFGGAEGSRKRISQKAHKELDFEVNRIVNEAYAQAKLLLEENMDHLHKVTTDLIEKETIDGAHILAILGKTAADAPDPA